MGDRRHLTAALSVAALLVAVVGTVATLPALRNSGAFETFVLLVGAAVIGVQLVVTFLIAATVVVLAGPARWVRDGDAERRRDGRQAREAVSQTLPPLARPALPPATQYRQTTRGGMPPLAQPQRPSGLPPLAPRETLY